ncbi:hypothetical protein ACFE04_025419 [Oxalis oulophora]
MVTTSFKSTTKRSTIFSDDSSSTSTTNRSSSSSSSNQHRRARSLSRFSRRLPDDDNLPTPPQPRGKFVNTVRGSGFPEISLDDLAVEFFHSLTGAGEGDQLLDSSPLSLTSFAGDVAGSSTINIDPI